MLAGAAGCPGLNPGCAAVAGDRRASGPAWTEGQAQRRCRRAGCDKGIGLQPGQGAGLRRAVVSLQVICPDEWIAKWDEMREEGTWYGRY